MIYATRFYDPYFCSWLSRLRTSSDSGYPLLFRSVLACICVAAWNHVVQLLPTTMDSGHPLTTLLQFQLASDGNAVLHLHYTLSALTPQTFEPSSHLSKWTARTNSLIHSKDAGARWAGLSIALRTSVLSQTIMLECAESWVTAALTLLSVGSTLLEDEYC